MKIIKFVISTAFLTGAFVAGATFAKIAKNKNIIEKIKKITIKKNLSASSKKKKE